ncbi:reverse transcriptase domain-containing protein [Tanacetum coccineum]
MHVLSLDSLIKCPKEILATENQLQLPAPRPVANPLRTGDPDKYYDYHQDKGHHTNDCIQLRKQLEIALESGKLNHLMKDLRHKCRMRSTGRNTLPLHPRVESTACYSIDYPLNDQVPHSERNSNYGDPRATIIARMQTLRRKTNTEEKQPLLLNVNPSLEPFCQKRRTFSPEKSKAVTNEVMKLMDQEDVLILNFELCCPKDYYPLPSIDYKVEAVMGFKYKCFLDAYKGYHQIQMAREDEEKTTLLQSREGNLRSICGWDMVIIKQRMRGSLGGDIGETKKSFSADEEADNIPFIINTTLSEGDTVCIPSSGKGGCLSSTAVRSKRKTMPSLVITNQPIKNILSRTEASGKLAKYAVEIGTYKISFIPRNAIKGQVLADFLSDAPDGEAEEDLKGSGAGLVLIGPNGLEYTYASSGYHLVHVTNNEAEYEALLAGLRIARKMKVSSIEVKVDSKLVANQINGTYEATKESMINYIRKADILSKLATVPFSHLTKEILVEVLNERSTDAKEVQTIVEEEGENWMTLYHNIIGKKD